MAWVQFSLVLKDILYLGVIALLCYLFYKERKSLLDRIMAESYKEYEYFRKMYDKDIKETEKLRKDARVEDEVDKEIEKEIDAEYEKEKEFLKQTEEDCEEDEIDLPKLREKITKE